MNEIQSKFDIDMKTLADLTHKLNSLASDPQPGLMTWNQFLVDNLREMKAFLERVGV